MESWKEELYSTSYGNDLYHYGILGMRWGFRRYQNEDGSLTAAGRERYRKNPNKIYELLPNELNSKTADQVLDIVYNDVINDPEVKKLINNYDQRCHEADQSFPYLRDDMIEDERKQYSRITFMYDTIYPEDKIDRYYPDMQDVTEEYRFNTFNQTKTQRRAEKGLFDYRSLYVSLVCRGDIDKFIEFAKKEGFHGGIYNSNYLCGSKMDLLDAIQTKIYAHVNPKYNVSAQYCNSLGITGHAILRRLFPDKQSQSAYSNVEMMIRLTRGSDVDYFTSDPDVLAKQKKNIATAARVEKYFPTDKDTLRGLWHPMLSNTDIQYKPVDEMTEADWKIFEEVVEKRRIRYD